jgi:hypothetical protein
VQEREREESERKRASRVHFKTHAWESSKGLIAMLAACTLCSFCRVKPRVPGPGPELAAT